MKNLNNKQIILAISGAIISAIGASICCLGPAVLAILGLSSAGLFSKFEVLRPYLIGIGVILLSSAFYLTYRKKEIMCEGGECNKWCTKAKQNCVMGRDTSYYWIYCFPVYQFTLAYIFAQSNNRRI